MIRNLFLALMAASWFGCEVPLNTANGNATNSRSTPVIDSLNITVSEIKSQAIPQDKRDSTRTYIGDYEVVRRLPASQPLSTRLINRILSDSDVVHENSRSCPFIPVYAVGLGKKITVLVSVSPCSKLQYVFPSCVDNAVVDLNADNPIENLLASIKSAAGK
jgi:hypothetical protein